MANLLRETLTFLASFDLTENDVLWVGDQNCYCDWEHFASTAAIDYDDGFGTEIINQKLIVVGKDWWLERHEYDGSEWWEFKQLPEKPGDYSNNIKIVSK